ncbi:MAG: hypothetical protein K2X47_02335 [Bdellovibrionales bacterium]|nr:hypothetical protein [Bdellovibrionales bacterium]
MNVNKLMTSVGLFSATLLVTAQSSWASREGHISCSLSSNPTPASPTRVRQKLYVFNGKSPVVRGSSQLLVNPKNIRYFIEHSFSTEEDRRAFEALPAIPSPLSYKVQLNQLKEFEAHFWVKTEGGVQHVGPLKVPYETKSGTYPIATFNIEIAEGLTPNLRGDEYWTWELELECVHFFP